MSPYRSTTVLVRGEPPICAECTHCRPGDDRDRVEQWRCHAAVFGVKPRWVHPITGTSVPERALMRRCEELNGEGQCTQFAPMTLRQRVARRRPALMAIGVFLSILAMLWLAS